MNILIKVQSIIQILLEWLVATLNRNHAERLLESVRSYYDNALIQVDYEVIRVILMKNRSIKLAGSKHQTSIDWMLPEWA